MKPIFPPPPPATGRTEAPRPIQGLPVPRRAFDPATAGGRGPQGPTGPKGRPIRLPSMSRGR